MILTIFGYPKTGKTLLFNILSGNDVEVSKFSATTNEFHKAVVDVPDDRLKRLAEYFNTPPVYAKIEFLDTGAISFGDAKNATFIDLLRRADGLVHVVRAFEDEEIIHLPGEINPQRDIDSIEEELITTDFLSIEKRLEKLKVDVLKIKSKELKEEYDLFLKLKDFVEKGKPLREYDFDKHEELIVKGYKFLSQKPIIHIINADETNYNGYKDKNFMGGKFKSFFTFCAKIENELLELEQEERRLFEEEYGLKDYEYVRENLIKKSYEIMNLISFFTVGGDETKAWTIEKGTDAFNAAGKIHSDIQQGFIRAEVIEWDKFLESGGFSKAKERGLLRLEGKDYIVKDGEIVHFRFNK